MSETESPVQLIPKNPAPGLLDAYNLQDDQTTIGRHPTNKVVIPLDSVSRFHARIDRRGDYYILQDLNSSNGSFVNGERITQMTIHHGDALTFGNIEFLFRNENSQSGVSTASALRGKNIVDISDDQEDQEPQTQSVIQAEVLSKEAKSSVISTGVNQRTDRKTLVSLNRRLAVLYRLSEILREGASEREEYLLSRVLDLIFQAVPADRGVMLTRFSPEAEELDVVAVKYADEPIVEQKVKVSRTILDQALNKRVSVLSRDAQADERFNASESIILSQIRSAICAPMMSHNQVIGVIHLDTSSTTKALSQEDLEFVTMIATETGVALENTRMRKEAMHRERLAAVGETLAGISHNVKNILLLSQGGAELLSRALDKNDIEGAKESWHVVQRGIDKIGKLVRDMLEYSGKKQVDYTEVDINEMVCNIAEEIEDELITKGITLELDLDENLEPRFVDEMGLQRTVMNLIVNAMEAITHDSGRIVVSTGQRADSAMVISIKDNGSGIPQNKLGKVFFPFFTTKGTAGTGLGLPMCKKVVEDMGGTIRVESEENVGTLFTIEIPYTTESGSGQVSKVNE